MFGQMRKSYLRFSSSLYFHLLSGMRQAQPRQTHQLMKSNAIHYSVKAAKPSLVLPDTLPMRHHELYTTREDVRKMRCSIAQNYKNKLQTKKKCNFFYTLPRKGRNVTRMQHERPLPPLAFWLGPNFGRLRMKSRCTPEIQNKSLLRHFYFAVHSVCTIFANRNTIKLRK